MRRIQKTALMNKRLSAAGGSQQNLSFPVDAELTMPMLDLKDHVYDVMSYLFLFLAFKETKLSLIHISEPTRPY